MGTHALNIACHSLLSTAIDLAEDQLSSALEYAKHVAARLAANSAMVLVPGGAILGPALYIATGHPALRPFGLPRTIQPRMLRIYLQTPAHPGIIPEIHFYRL